MSRINDVGGLTGFGPITVESDEPPFHADWEAHVWAMLRSLLAAKVFNLDEFRDAVEQIPVRQYLSSSYYERWFTAITHLLLTKAVITDADAKALTDD